MEDLEHLKDLELRLFELKDQKGLIEDQEKELREKLKSLIPNEGYRGPFLTMTWRDNHTDWRAVVYMLVEGDIEIIDRYAEEYKRPGKVFYVTYTPQKRKGRSLIPKIESQRLIVENQLDAVNDQQRRLEELKNLVEEYKDQQRRLEELKGLVADYMEDSDMDDPMLVEWWSQLEESD